MQPLLQWKAMSSRDPERVFAAFVIQHAMRMRHTVICGMSGYTNNIFHIISHTARFLREKKYLS
jgi:hypothetical protein